MEDVDYIRDGEKVKGGGEEVSKCIAYRIKAVEK